MKKLFIAALTAALILGSGTTAYAAGCRHSCTNRTCSYSQSRCPDADKDGICDKCGKKIGKDGYCKNHRSCNSQKNGHGSRHHR